MYIGVCLCLNILISQMFFTQVCMTDKSGCDPRLSFDLWRLMQVASYSCLRGSEGKKLPRIQMFPLGKMQRSHGGCLRRTSDVHGKVHSNPPPIINIKKKKIFENLLSYDHRYCINLDLNFWEVVTFSSKACVESCKFQICFFSIQMNVNILHLSVNYTEKNPINTPAQLSSLLLQNVLIVTSTVSYTLLYD